MRSVIWLLRLATALASRFSPSPSDILSRLILAVLLESISRFRYRGSRWLTQCDDLEVPQQCVALSIAYTNTLSGLSRETPSLVAQHM